MNDLFHALNDVTFLYLSDRLFFMIGVLLYKRVRVFNNKISLLEVEKPECTFCAILVRIHPT